MESFKKLAGFLSFLFGTLLVGSVIWTGYQLNDIGREIRPLEVTKRNIEQSLEQNSEILAEETRDFRRLEAATQNAIDDCISFNVNENGVAESSARDFCDAEILGTEQPKLLSAESRVLRWERTVATNEAELSSTQAALDTQTVARAAVISSGVTLGVSLTAVWGAFQLVFLWGSYVWKKENDLD